VACLEDETNQCERAPFCKTLPMWKELDKIINDYLDSVTLQDMLEQSADNWVI
jgi:DNA-binding IscR family transcriptional regulator